MLPKATYKLVGISRIYEALNFWVSHLKRSHQTYDQQFMSVSDLPSYPITRFNPSFCFEFLKKANLFFIPKISHRIKNK